MFEFLLKIVLGSLAFTSGESAFKDESTRQASYAKAASMTETEALVGIVHSPFTRDALFSNGVLVAPDLVLTHSHDEWALGDLVYSPYKKGFGNITMTSIFKPYDQEIYMDDPSMNITDSILKSPAGSLNSVVDIQCHPARRVAPMLPTEVNFLDIQTARDLPFHNRERYREKSTKEPLHIGDENLGIYGPDLCLLRLKKPFKGIKYFPSLGSTADLPATITPIVLAAHYESFLQDGGSNVNAPILAQLRTDVTQAFQRSKEFKHLRYNFYFPVRTMAFEQPMYVYDEALVAEARAASKPSTGLHDEVFIPEGPMTAVIQGGFSGAPVIWNGQIIGIVSHAHLSLLTQNIENIANKARFSHPRLAQNLAALSPNKIDHPLHNIYTRVDDRTREWIEAVRNNGSAFVSVPARGPDTLEERY